MFSQKRPPRYKGVSLIKPDDSGGEINSAKEGCGAFIVSGGDGAVLYEFGKEILDVAAPRWRTDGETIGTKECGSSCLLTGGIQPLRFRTDRIYLYGVSSQM